MLRSKPSGLPAESRRILQPLPAVSACGPSGRRFTIFHFLKHIFGEQIEMGYDYFKILLERPTQILPILCLVSEERGTGKTTFLHFVKSIFGENMTINSNEDFRSNFNIEWAQKLVIGVDETFLDRKEDSERIKNLSTACFYKVEAKGVDRQETEFLASLSFAATMKIISLLPSLERFGTGSGRCRH
ncbi:DUF5906 domain-containing protein [Dyadobacter chenwenxiniae]|uniref:DUF5906 domain-containing protein n=1 Tax=Dyadobacter chenwenxiniae TaxID=2906456 RepID=A0A9X1TFJ8_9BACT|nr:primase-helicase family protein [Dyadobacter chenwenxiniae]MCF0064421.1 DUF5906 domain-containing protein [Dyadobacter chenwenxiniae]UON82374.1 DUF5906 domain-containing protein [Dyadobacter chenwenxiniae]